MSDQQENASPGFMNSEGRGVFLFVNLSVDSGYYGVNHGIAYLVPIVRKHSYTARLLHIGVDMDEEEFREKISELNPSIVAYSFTSPQVKFLEKYSRAAKDIPGILQIAGGVGATVSPEEVLLRTSVDGLVMGEGEIPLDLLLTALREHGNIHETRGFCWRVKGELQKNEIPQFVSDLDALDFPDYSLFDHDVIFSVGTHLSIILSRGCPYSCNYCSNPVLRGVYASQRGYCRVHSVEYSMKLLEHLIKEFPKAEGFGFEDDLLISRKKWFFNFADEYRKRIGLPYRMNVRAEDVDEEIVDALKKSGCFLTLLGVETGNEEFRKKILNRHHSNAELIQKAKLLRNAGIKLFSFNIVGFPFEKRRHLRDTLKINKKIKADDGVCTFFYPLPGTKLYEMCKSEGLLRSERELEMPTNYNTYPLIPDSLRQRKACIKTQKQLKKYFKRATTRKIRKGT
jgi:anaerobic magnesium-protoporphyrin IX monomethyl ester cyclase